MVRVFRTKLLPPRTEGALARPRLLEQPRPSLLVLQAPAGSGKSIFLAQWLEAQGLPYLYYQLDDQDREGEVFAAHLLEGLRRLWPDWSTPDGAEVNPADLAVEVVNEAVARPPFVLALDGLQAAFGQPYLADLLAVWLRYAPPGLTLALASRSPLPVELPESAQYRLGAVALAFTPEETQAWLGHGDWHECLQSTGGLPLALQLWRQSPATWRQALSQRAVAELPPHVPPEAGRALVAEWLSGQMTLAQLAYQLSEGQPGAERLWHEAQAARSDLLMGDVAAALTRLSPLWDRARGSGDRPLMGAVALLRGEYHYVKGEYGQAMEWYRQAFEADPVLEYGGTHSMVAILKDQGQLEEGLARAERCIQTCRTRGDLQALAYAHQQCGAVLAESDRLDEAESHYLEAERIGLKLSGEPFYGILALAHRGMLQRKRQNMTLYRQLAEEAHALARHRSPWLEHICGFILAGAMVHWKEPEAAQRLAASASAFLAAVDSKWQLHLVHITLAGARWAMGAQDEARRHVDQALVHAAREGYVQALVNYWEAYGHLVIDALSRDVEPSFCQEICIRVGQRALAPLLELTAHAEPRARRGALYPLAVIGGPEAERAIRHLLYDQEELVRDGALVALRSLTGKEEGAVGTPTAVAPVAVARLRLFLLGPIAVEVAGERVSAWRTAKARDLIAYLALAGGRPVTRDQLIEALWPETEPEAGQALLHTTLYYLRRALKGAGEGLITYAGGAYRLELAGVEVDYQHLLALLESGGEANWRQAVALYQGELLQGLDYPWAEAPRTRAHGACMEALRSLAGAAQSAGRHGEAVECWQRLVQADPLAEEGHLGLMRCYAALGNRNAALQQFQTLQQRLDEELGLEPSPEARKLYTQLIL